MLTSVTAPELRKTLGAYLDRVRVAQDAFVVTRSGHRVVVLLSAEEYAALVERIGELEAQALPVIVVPAEPRSASNADSAL